MKSNPLISIIVPVYNPGSHLHCCLDSIVGQTYRNLQIILIDDGSTDGSGEVCDQYAAKDDRIVVVHLPNSGVSKARNTGLEIANGDYFHFPDSDDYLEPDTYEYLLDTIREHNCDMVNFEYFVTYTDHENRHILTDDHYGLVDTFGAHRLILTGEPFAWNKFFSKKLITANDHLLGIKFREDIFRGEDSLFAHEATDRAEKVWFDKRPLYHYVQSEESACRGKFRRSQLSALKLYDAYKPMFQEKYPELWSIFLPGMAHLMVSLYYDMWVDKNDFWNEQKLVESTYKEHYKETLDRAELGKKERIKFALFMLSPTVFCIMHKISISNRSGFFG